MTVWFNILYISGIVSPATWWSSDVSGTVSHGTRSLFKWWLDHNEEISCRYHRCTNCTRVLDAGTIVLLASTGWHNKRSPWTSPNGTGWHCTRWPGMIILLLVIGNKLEVNQDLDRKNSIIHVDAKKRPRSC